ncbi:hypothetical protein [Paenibacillus cisolokensis]|uniref:hypothetical protein n=1 Tax=Paenibacillus cisolokensis TaxID=1658519 RepID=UPI001BCAC7B9|nr:hypothetical protein [Paenibacillus cisolokensis]
MKPSSPLPVPLFLPLLAGMAAISFAPILVRLSDAPVSVQGMYRMLFTIAIMLPLGTGRLPSARAIAGKDWLLLGAAGFFWRCISCYGCRPSTIRRLPARRLFCRCSRFSSCWAP